MSHNQLSANELSLKEKIAQLFLMGFSGSDITENSAVLHMIKHHKPGGVILFDMDMVHDKPVHNIQSPEQVKRLTTALHEASELPLFIGIDQEGGIVNRLKPEYGFPPTKSHKTLGSQQNVEATEQEGEKIAHILAEAGINLNFAPVVDLTLNEKSSIIAKKERSFGSSAEQVTNHARAYIKGHRKHHIVTCCKHFPGHGSAEGDTHAGFVDVTDTWSEDELIPYKKLIGEGLCPMIMTAHIFNKNFDADKPATLSKYVLQDLLRDQLNYKGVVISDDMQMRAISDHYDLKESLKAGISAGLDLFCFGNNLLKEQIELPDAIAAVEELVQAGEVTEKRIEASAQRILDLKATL
jgi:beta-N-acetylhexosaminidase